MFSQEATTACLDAAAADLKAMSYEELEEFAESHGMFDDWQTRELQIDGVVVEVYVLAGKLGRIRKRISMETNLGSVGGQVPERTYFDYFERYESGRLHVPVMKEWEKTMLKALPYAFFGGVVIGLLVLVWHLFLRGG